jgi:gamma-glutamyl-gamma-aminobutyrate hydrolase PuuD
MNTPVTAERLRELGLLPDENSKTNREHSIDDVYPKLGYKVFIVGSCFLSGIVEMFAKANCTKAKSIEEADLLCFSGGEDVDPSLYGEKPLKGTYFNVARDAREADVFAKAIELDKPMFGICRGMQFLHVMNGGKLWQDVHNHGWRHKIELSDGSKPDWWVSSMHHQMCIPNEATFPLAFAAQAGLGARYSNQNKTLESNAHRDLEAAVYPNIRAIAVQGHPEVGGYPEYTMWCLNEVKNFVENGFFADNLKPISEVEFIKKEIK